MSPTNTNLPPHLDVFVDFLSIDDRPTFILERCTNLVPVFRNAALNALVPESENAHFLSWVDSLNNIVGDHVANLGTFASRIWSCKSLGGPWIIVFCSQDNKLEHQVAVQPKLPLQSEAPSRELSSPQQSQNQETCHGKNPAPVHQQKSRDESTNSNSQTSVLAKTGKLEEWTVDWLASPHLTTDPWIHFLVKHDWQSTAAGPMHTWHPTLRQIYSTVLSSTEPRALYWGNDLCMFYNAASRFLVGDMHPLPLGNPLAEVWGAPMCAHLTENLITGIKQGKAVHNKRTELVIKRGHLPESCFYDFVFLPIPSPDGRFMGFINEFTEITTTVLQENRRDVSKALLEDVARAFETRELWTSLTRVLEDKSKDVSFAIVYAHDHFGSQAPMRAQSAFGIENFSLDVSTLIDAALKESTNKVVVLEQKRNTLPPELAVSVPDIGTVNTAYVLPINGLHGDALAAVIVLGLSPVRLVDSNSLQFFESLRDLLFKSVTLFSLPLEQRRARELTTDLSHQLELATIKAEKSEKNFTSMVQNSPIGMCMDRNDGYPIYVNDMYLELMGMDRTDFYKVAKTGFTWRSALFKDDTDLIEETWRAAVNGGKTTSFEICMKSDAPSRSRWLEVSVQQRHDENGETVFIFSWLTDVSARKMTESLAKERLAEALENKRASENFIDMVRLLCSNSLISEWKPDPFRYHTRCVILCQAYCNWPIASRCHYPLSPKAPQMDKPAL